MNIKEWDREHLWRFRAHVWRPIDGDTFVALPDCGFNGAAFPHIRLLDFNAVERFQPGGPEATALLWSALHHYDVLDWPLRIESKIKERVTEGTKTFDRYVATVWAVDAQGEMIDVRDIIHALANV